MIGIDAPLGWPRPFREAIVAHAAGGPWPDWDAEPDSARRRLRLRLTDRRVAELAGVTPLSVSSDLIGVVAFRAAALCSRLVSELEVTIDRSGITGAVAEVYPAGALAAWGLRRRGSYAGAGAEALERRRQIAVGLGTRFGEPVSEAAGAAAESPASHRLDAILCALLAGLVSAGGTIRPEPAELELAREEGWIHLPHPGGPGPKPDRSH